MAATLRILTANLRNGGADPRAFAELVAAWEVDVVAVQELGPEQARALAEVRPHGQLDPGRDFRGMGIALARPAKPARIPSTYRDVHAVQLDPEHWPEIAAPLEILNVHVAAPHVWKPWRQLDRRRRQLSDLLAHVDAAPARPRLLVGDLNATPAWPVYRRIAERFEDLAHTHARSRRARPARTWPRGSLPLLRIDHCFGSGLCAERVEVVDLPGSDHRGLLADVVPR
jgi:endonuclease/exonuclease/phosphatase family metal-dependent hydrolase